MSEETPFARHSSTEEADRIRQERNICDNLSLRLMYAEAVAEKTAAPLSRVLYESTDAHARVFGFIPGPDPESAHPGWAALAEEIDAAATHEDRVAILARYVRKYAHERKDHSRDRYWPFRYDPPGEDGVVKLHFGSMELSDSQDSDEPGILSRERLEEQRAKLKAMFAEIKQKYPHARLVRGASWLYNREAYRRLFPPAYTAKPVPRKTGEFVGGGTWGQFRKKDGSVDAKVRNEFESRLKQIDLNDPHKVFPVETLMVEGPIEDFYREYGINTPGEEDFR